MSDLNSIVIPGNDLVGPGGNKSGDKGIVFTCTSHALFYQKVDVYTETVGYPKSNLATFIGNGENVPMELEGSPGYDSINYVGSLDKETITVEFFYKEQANGSYVPSKRLVVTSAYPDGNVWIKEVKSEDSNDADTNDSVLKITVSDYTGT